MVQTSGLLSRDGLKTVRGFKSHPLRQLGNEVIGSSRSSGTRHPILNAKLNFLSLFREAERQKRAFRIFID